MSRPYSELMKEINDQENIKNSANSLQDDSEKLYDFNESILSQKNGSKKYNSNQNQKMESNKIFENINVDKTMKKNVFDTEKEIEDSDNSEKSENEQNFDQEEEENNSNINNNKEQEFYNFDENYYKEVNDIENSKEKDNNYFKEESHVPDFNRNSDLVEDKELDDYNTSEESLEEDEDYIKNLKECLKKLFNFYSSFGNRMSNNKMKCSQFLKLCTDSKITDRHLDQKSIEIAFIQINKSQMNLSYEKFVNLLHQIGQIKYDFQDPNENFKHLLEKNIMPLFNTVYNETDLGIEDKILRSKINLSTYMILHLRKEYFYAIYKKFFTEEIQNLIVFDKKKLLQKSKKHLMNFLREFELLPGLLNISIVNNFYIEILGLNFLDSSLKPIQDLQRIMGLDLGHIFTFHRFVFFIVKISIYIFSDPENIPKKFRLLHFTSDEKFYMLLERMEISGGFFNLKIKKNKNKNKRLTFLTKELADMHKETSCFPNFEDYLDGDENSSWMLLNFDFDIHKNKNKNQFLFKKLYARQTTHLKNNYKKEKPKKLYFEPEFRKAIQTYKEDLRKIYYQYASKKNDLNNTKANSKNNLSSFKFIQFLKDSKIVRTENPLEEEVNREEKDHTILIKEADLIFTSVTHSNLYHKNSRFNKKNKNKIIISKKIDFPHFLKAIEKIIKKIFPNLSIVKRLENIFYLKISKYLLKNREQNEKKKKIPEQINIAEKSLQILAVHLEDPKVIGLLEIVHRFLNTIYFEYTSKERLMTYLGFFQFFKDFGIFPDIISNVKLESIFNALSNIYQQNPEKKKSYEEVIDEHVFVESMILIADDLKFKFKVEPNIYQKITFLIDIMNESEGFNIIRGRNGVLKRYDVLGVIRKKFPDYFIV